VKNLEPQTETKTVAGDLETLQKRKGRFVKFLSALENDGIYESSAKLYVAYLKRIEGSGGNLLNPVSVKAAIAKKKWNPATKALAVAAYSKYLGIVGGTWRAPKYPNVRKLPYVPIEKELDCLINAAYNKQSAFLLLLKETGMRSSEAWNLKWKDIDFERNALTLNETLKHGNPRMFKVSPKLTAVLNTLPKTSETYIFQKDPPTPFGLLHFSRTFRNLRKRVAQKMQNPNLDRITFHTFRHWYATTLYHKNGGKLLQVQEKLGHKSILTTTIYTHLINLEADAYNSAVADTVEEARKLVEAGF
jgi:integrase